MFFAHGYTVTRLRRSRIANPYGGEPEPASWTDPDYPPEEVEIPGCVIAPASTSEFSEPGRATVTDGQALYGPVDVDIRAGDRVRSPDGTEWDVTGLPRRYTNPFTGWQAGSETPLQAARG